MMHVHHILVPIDFSSGSSAAFQTAVDLARENGARLTLLHVHHVAATALPDAFFSVTPELMQDLEHSVDIGLSELVEIAREAGIEAVARTQFGSTAREICDAAEQLSVDLIVIGTHGHSGFAHAILGSVAERVVRRACCPVLTVRPQLSATAHP